jgi:protease-4
MSSNRQRDAGRALGRVAGNIGLALRDAVAWPVARALPRDWLVLRLDHGLSDAPTTAPWLLESTLPRPRCTSDVLRALELAGRDAQLKGVLVRLGADGLGWGQAVELAHAFGRVRAAGKHLVVYSEHAGNAAVWLGGLAERFWLTPEGRLDLVGIRADGLFLKRVLERFGVRPDVLAAGDYKSAGEMFTRDSMSEPAREALAEIVDELYAQLVRGLAEGRAGDEARAREWIDGGPYLASQAREAGIVDDLVYVDELPRKLAELEGRALEDDEEPVVRFVTETLFLQLAGPRFQFRPLQGRGEEVAVVPVTGMIRPGAGASRGVVGLLRRLADDERVGAVVLRVNSSGGDVLASDLIAHAVEKLDAAKPVVASMGDIAASGGYYIAMMAREILAEPTTITGSIGVVLAGVDFEALLDRLGVDPDGLHRGRRARIYDVTRPRDEEERAVLREQVERIYAQFVEKVARARGLDETSAEAAARGRIWSGAAARERGLVDRLGGLDEAIARARALAELSPRGRIRLHAPAQTPWARWRQSDPLDGSASTRAGAQFWCPVRIPLT